VCNRSARPSHPLRRRTILSVRATGLLLAAGDLLLALVPNADHRRSPLVSLTERGKATYAVTDRRQAAWANRLAGGRR
jgi:hypothetical protein